MYGVPTWSLMCDGLDGAHALRPRHVGGAQRDDRVRSLRRRQVSAAAWFDGVRRVPCRIILRSSLKCGSPVRCRQLPKLAWCDGAGGLHNMPRRIRVRDWRKESLPMRGGDDHSI